MCWVRARRLVEFGAGRVRPHRLRHTCGTELASAGIELMVRRGAAGGTPTRRVAARRRVEFSTGCGQRSAHRDAECFRHRNSASTLYT
ncbi:MAG: site-specific integrase [Rhodococcus sp. (in: high G+C Gram-positive bacteria)]|nr:MAG: site-specific integrase [Rhodococcus sp. (in: high G+C Gram-positive bacteria)]